MNESVNLTDYKTIIFDVDGVILDTNNIKKENIYKATFIYTNQKTAENFTNHFTSLNGIPREKKIFEFFDANIGSKILRKYNDLNEENLKTASLTQQAKRFILKASENSSIFALSGGTQQEVVESLLYADVSFYFKAIFGGPASKDVNLCLMDIERPVAYIGDSVVDFELAKKFNLDFIFMHGHTQQTDWLNKISGKPTIAIIKNLGDLVDSYR